MSRETRTCPVTNFEYYCSEHPDCKHWDDTLEDCVYAPAMDLLFKFIKGTEDRLAECESLIRDFYLNQGEILYLLRKLSTPTKEVDKPSTKRKSSYE